MSGKFIYISEEESRVLARLLDTDRTARSVIARWGEIGNVTDPELLKRLRALDAALLVSCPMTEDCPTCDGIGLTDTDPPHNVMDYCPRCGGTGRRQRVEPTGALLEKLRVDNKLVSILRSFREMVQNEIRDLQTSYCKLDVNLDPIVETIDEEGTDAIQPWVEQLDALDALLAQTRMEPTPQQDGMSGEPL